MKTRWMSSYVVTAVGVLSLAHHGTSSKSSSVIQPSSLLKQQHDKKHYGPFSITSMVRNEQRSTATVTSIQRGGGDASTDKSAVQGEGTATIPSLIFNLVKSIVGAGVLSLPAGIAAFGDAPSAILPAVILVISIGSLSAYNFSLIGRVCAMTNATSYRSAWDNTVGTSTSWITALFCTAQCLVANLAYSMILADTFRALLQVAGYTLSRSQTLFGAMTCVILPLCLLKNLSSLAPFSLLGICGMIYTALAMSLRYLMKSYALPDGKFVSKLSSPQYTPSFGSKGAAAVFHPSSLVLLCMLSAAFVAHYIAPKFYVELYDNTVSRFNILTFSSFAISMVIFLIVASMGFLTFGSNCDGLILNNYSSEDKIMGFSRVAVAMSLVFS